MAPLYPRPAGPTPRLRGPRRGPKLQTDARPFSVPRPRRPQGVSPDRGHHWHALPRPDAGRVLDWARNAAVPAERAQVRELLGWLLAPDAYGNPHAMARRLGVMYIIWNRRMWSSWDAGWEVICVQKGKRCRDPETGAAVHAHRDHVHFSFGWPGARMLTTFWHPELTQPSPSPTPSPSTSP